MKGWLFKCRPETIPRVNKPGCVKPYLELWNQITFTTLKLRRTDFSASPSTFNVSHPFPAPLSSTLLQSCMDMRFEPLAHKKAASKCTQLSCVTHVWSGTILTLFVKPLSRRCHASHVSTAFLRWEKHFFFHHTKNICLDLFCQTSRKVLSEDETEDWGALPHPPSQETCVKEVILWMYTYAALSVTLRTVCPVALTTFCVWTMWVVIFSVLFSKHQNQQLLRHLRLF